MGDLRPNKLREMTAAAIEKTYLSDEAIRQAQVEREKTESRRKSALISRFVSEQLPITIEYLEKAAYRAAELGDSSASKVWPISALEYNTPNLDEIEKYEKLARKVAGHFKKEGFATTVINNAREEEDRRGRSDDGYWPTVYVGQTVSVGISWDQEK